MNWNRKLAKFFTGEAFESAMAALYRARHPIEPEAVMRQVDPKGLHALREKYDQPYDKIEWPKYTNPSRWLPKNIRRAQDLQLASRARPLRILDLGSGAGYFLLIAKHLGHSGVGTDIDIHPFYQEIFDLFGLERRVWRIEAFEPLPDLGEQFDLVTAYSVCFNGHKTSSVWGPSEWAFFLDHLKTDVLKPGGEIAIELNPEPGDIFYSPELLNFFVKRGAIVRRQKVRFPADAIEAWPRGVAHRSMAAATSA